MTRQKTECVIRLHCNSDLEELKLPPLHNSDEQVNDNMLNFKCSVKQIFGDKSTNKFDSFTQSAQSFVVWSYLRSGRWKISTHRWTVLHILLHYSQLTSDLFLLGKLLKFIDFNRNSSEFNQEFHVRGIFPYVDFEVGHAKFCRKSTNVTISLDQIYV